MIGKQILHCIIVVLSMNQSQVTSAKPNMVWSLYRSYERIPVILDIVIKVEVLDFNRQITTCHDFGIISSLLVLELQYK